MRGDQLRAFQQIRALSARHRITLVVADSVDPDAAALAAMQACCERVILLPRRRLAMAARLLRALIGQMPLQVAAFESAALIKTMNTLRAAASFDLAHVQLARLGPMIARLAPVPCVLDFVDALSLNMRRRAAMDSGPVGRIAAIEAGRLARYERVLCAQARHAAVCSVLDRDTIGDFPNLHLVRNGVDLERFPFVPSAQRGAGVVFVGNLGYFPNVDAASWFASEVMPRVIAARADARLQLVGARPAPSLRTLVARLAGVELVGEVPDVHPYLARAAVAVVPMRSGSGQQLKMLEAMAAGTPVVATSLSAQGLGMIDGEHLLIADEPVSMSMAVLRLLDDPALARRLADAAHRRVAAQFGWAESNAELERLWLRAADTAARIG